MNLLQIANGGLIKLGARTIESFNEDSKEAELCKARIPYLLRAVLRSHVWSFAKKVVEINPEPTPPADASRWGNQFKIPTDCTRLLKIEPHPYELLGVYILSNSDKIVVRYVSDVTALDLTRDYPEDFGEALASLLASDISVSLFQNTTLKDTFYQEYLDKLRTARFNGATEREPMVLLSENWLQAHDQFGDVDPSVRDLDLPAGGV